jgi:IclR family acetate operon transcriptional repressor
MEFEMSERSTSVQSVERAFAILEAMAQENQEMGVTQLAEKLSLPAPTIHRSMKTLVALGYARQNATLLALSSECGETVNLATLEGELIVYTAQSPSRHSMRMFTEVGRRVLPHSCGVGKAIMSQLTDSDAQKIVKHTGMPRFTPTTLTSWKELKVELEKIRQTGYAIDEGEQEIGVRCIAVSVPGMTTPTAVSISGPQTRVDKDFIRKYLPSILRAADALSAEFSRVSSDDLL